MIAVIFEPRFGSSKVMQALADSGYPVIGEKFPSWFSKAELSHNPLGFWEHPDPSKVIREGIGNAAIKLRIAEAMSIPLPKDTRFILCDRDNVDATKSQIKFGLFTPDEIDIGINKNQLQYELWEEWALARIWESNPDQAINLSDDHMHLTVKHEDWLANPAEEKERLLRWVNGLR